MSYSTVATCANDASLQRRVISAVVQEGGSTNQVSSDYQWKLSSASDIQAAYASALESDNPDPGGDESVITDGMLLAYVQGNPPPPNTNPIP